MVLSTWASYAPSNHAEGFPRTGRKSDLRRLHRLSRGVKRRGKPGRITDGLPSVLFLSEQLRPHSDIEWLEWQEWLPDEP